jgi:hypothetical protein
MNEKEAFIQPYLHSNSFIHLFRDKSIMEPKIDIQFYEMTEFLYCFYYVTEPYIIYIRYILQKRYYTVLNT